MAPHRSGAHILHRAHVDLHRASSHALGALGAIQVDAQGVVATFSAQRLEKPENYEFYLGHH